jgi:DNA-binding GntR family transcriptional regulator
MKLKVQPQLTELVYNALVDAICEGKLKAGERIWQLKLAQQFGVSRQPIQQALMLLKKEGFVDSSGSQGLIVTPLDSSFVENIYQIRYAIDGLACRETAVRFNANFEKRGRSLLRAGHEAVASGSVARLIAADMNFHRFLYEASGNPLISEVMQLHWQHIRRIMGRALQDTTGQSIIWDEHEAILTATLSGDPDRAERAARAHTEHTAQRLMPMLTAGSMVLKSRKAKLG